MAACFAVAVVVGEAGFGEAGRALFVIPAIAAGTAVDAAFGAWRDRRRRIRMQRYSDAERDRAQRANTRRLREAGVRQAIMREEVDSYRVPPAALVPVAWIWPHRVPGPGRSEPGAELGGTTGGVTGRAEGVPLLASLDAEFIVDGHPLLVRSTVRHLVLSLLAATPRATLRVTCGGRCAWSRSRSDGAEPGPLAVQEASESPDCTCGEWLGVPYLGAESAGYFGSPDTSTMRARARGPWQRPGAADEKRARGCAAQSRRAVPHAYLVGEDPAQAEGQVKGQVKGQVEGQSRATAAELMMERPDSFSASELRQPTVRSAAVSPSRELPVLNVRFRHATRGPPERGGPPRWQVVVCLCETNQTETGSETGEERETGEEQETAVPDRAYTVERRGFGARPRVTLAVLGLPPGLYGPESRPTAPDPYADGTAIGSEPGDGTHAENGAGEEGALGVAISDDRGWSVRGRIFDLVSRDEAQEWARRNGR